MSEETLTAADIELTLKAADMRWKKVPEAATEWAGNVSPKTMYGAIRAGKLKAARIGSGRNVLICEQYVDAWLTSSVRSEIPHVERPVEANFGARRRA